MNYDDKTLDDLKRKAANIRLAKAGAGVRRKVTSRQPIFNPKEKEFLKKVAVACAVMLLGTWIITDQVNNRTRVFDDIKGSIEEANNQVPSILPEDEYSIEAIQNLEASINTEYSNLINAIIDNESNKIESPNGKNRLDAAIDDYAKFRDGHMTNKVNYSTYNDESRIGVVGSLNAEELRLLRWELEEAKLKATKLDINSPEYKMNQETIAELNRKINTNVFLNDAISEYNLTQSIDTGKSR